jgi:hypothetical protein
METIMFSVSHNWGTTKVKEGEALRCKIGLTCRLVADKLSNSAILTHHCNTNGRFGAW